jgi:tetratricopeptide (TPR) repeat protein
MDALAAPARAKEWTFAGIKVALVAAAAVAVYVVYSRHVRVVQQVAEMLDGPRTPSGRSGGARQEILRDSPGAWLSAEKKLEVALVLHPKNVFALAALADVETMLAGAGYPDRAARAEQARTRIEERNLSLPERHEARGLWLLQQGKARECEQYVSALLDRYPLSHEPARGYDLLGRAQRAQGKLREARTSFKKAAEADSRQPRPAADYGEALLEAGSAADAIAAFDRALQANPEHPRARIGKARALLAVAREGGGDLRRPRELLDRLLADGTELTPELRGRILAARAEVRLAQQDAAGASADADAALLVQPRLAAALRARALVSASVRELRGRALGELRSAIAADPFDQTIWFDGAQALVAAGDAPAAERLLGADPANPAASLARARLQQKRTP